MFARNVRLKLKPNSAIKYSRLFESQILPVLRQQPGFKDGMTMVSGERAEAVAISFWDKRESADEFSREAYGSLIEQLDSVLSEPPEVMTLVVANPTSLAAATGRS